MRCWFSHLFFSNEKGRFDITFGETRATLNDVRFVIRPFFCLRCDKVEWRQI